MENVEGKRFSSNRGRDETKMEKASKLENRVK